MNRLVYLKMTRVSVPGFLLSLMISNWNL